uniref:hypothetical protein n=1 Tax=Methanosarcina horonobensis TaxID=418008 RepID=UPI0022B8ACAC|nr:hypothetical protein [Methanosarcina horonobensis]
MFPVPIVAESAVLSAAKLETSPCTPISAFRELRTYLRARGSLKIWIRPRRQVRKIPVPTSKTRRGSPQISSSILVRVSSKFIPSSSIKLTPG